MEHHWTDRTIGCALLTLALLVSPAAPAAQGDLYSAFGRGGIAVEPAPVGARPAYATFVGRDPGPAVVIAPDGTVLTARAEGGRCHLERLGVDGLGGLVSLGEAVTCSDRLRPEVSVGPGGDILYVYAPDAASIAIQRRRPEGSLVTSFGNGGTVLLRPFTEGPVGRCFAMLLPDGDVMVAANGATTSTQSHYSTVMLIRLRADGSRANWGSGGIVLLPDFEWGPLGAEGVGIASDASGVKLYGSGSTTLYGSERYGFFRQSFGVGGDFYPYFAPETSVDSSAPVLSEFNDGSLAALYTYRGELSYDGPSARFAALPTSALLKLQLPSALTSTGSRLTPLRFRPLQDGGLLLAALHEEPVAGALHGQVVLLRFMPGGRPDANFGRDGVAMLDLGLGGPPYSLPRMLSAPTLIGQDRVMLAGWGSGYVGAASLQVRALGAASGTIGWQARDGGFSTGTDSADATLRFRVARHGGRKGALSVNYRSRAPAELAGRYTPVTGRIDWPDGDDTPREIAIALRTPPVEGVTGTIELVLEAAAGAAHISSAVQQVVISDYSAGTLAFEQEQTSVAAGAGTLRLGLKRSGGARGAVTAAVRVPLEGSAGLRTVSWADGETGTKHVEVPFDTGWDRFVAELEAPPRTRVGSPASVSVMVTAAAAPPASTAAPAPAPLPLPTTSGSGGGALDPPMLGLLLAALLASTRSGRRGIHRGAETLRSRGVQCRAKTRVSPAALNASTS